MAEQISGYVLMVCAGFQLGVCLCALCDARWHLAVLTALLGASDFLLFVKVAS